MSKLIQNLHIKNFKSVRDLSLDCDRINIFIGKPNAGKSNILEAISLLGADYSEGRFMDGMVRYETIPQLFSRLDYRGPLTVVADETRAELRATSWGASKFKFHISSPPPTEKSGWRRFTPLTDLGLSVEGRILERGSEDERSPVKKYVSLTLGNYRENGLFLHPPHGDNFYLIVRSHKELREEIQQFLKPNGLKLLLDEGTKRVSVVQEEEDSLLSFPLHLVPDTFQRYIFHLAAIMSNRDSVLLFEEPESHSYAPYIYQLAQHILDDEGGNQYFITTHNPYLLTPILQETKEVALFVTWFENYQTRARRLSEDEVADILNYGMDVFLNLKHFIPE